MESLPAYVQLALELKLKLKLKLVLVLEMEAVYEWTPVRKIECSVGSRLAQQTAPPADSARDVCHWETRPQDSPASSVAPKLVDSSCPARPLASPSLRRACGVWALGLS